MNKMQASNAVAILQKEPLYYRNFGVWWWHIKAELKRNGYGADQLFHLGSFTDPSVSHYYEGMSTVERDNEAYEVQYANALNFRNNNLSTAPDGERYLICDQDVE